MAWYDWFAAWGWSSYALGRRTGQRTAQQRRVYGAKTPADILNKELRELPFAKTDSAPREFLKKDHITDKKEKAPIL
jgi:hypothetical protein